MCRCWRRQPCATRCGRTPRGCWRCMAMPAPVCSSGRKNCRASGNNNEPAPSGPVRSVVSVALALLVLVAVELFEQAGLLGRRLVLLLAAARGLGLLALAGL